MADAMSTDQTARYLVPGITCEHCKRSIGKELGELAGVRAVEVDLELKLVTVRGRELDVDAIRVAIDQVGYEAVVA